MGSEGIADHTPQRKRAVAARRFERAEFDALATDAHELLVHPHGAAQEVDAVHHEAEQHSDRTMSTEISTAGTVPRFSSQCLVFRSSGQPTPGP
jgi:hypothetical protein